jgi:two-component system, response regulator PdtaR
MTSPPCEVDRPVTEATPKRRSLPPDRPSRIILADDEHLVASGLAHNLSELGFEVAATAADGVEAIEMCKNLRPDLALLDIHMPRMDGLAAAEVIFRQMGIPVVILSAFSENSYVAGANHAGVFGYVLKPVTVDQLRVNLAIAWGRFLDFSLQNSEIVGLKERLADRKIIEQAKWIIVKRKGVTEPDAQRLLQRLARNNRRTLADVARSLVENEEIFGDENAV